MSPTTSHLPNDASRCRVLVVDHDASIRELLRAVLSDDGYMVLDCGDASAAWALIQAFQPQVLVLDVLEPNSDEGRLLSVYRQFVGSRAPILGITTAINLSGQADRLGLAALLSKPFDLECLLSYVWCLVTRETHLPSTSGRKL